MIFPNTQLEHKYQKLLDTRKEYELKLVCPKILILLKQA